MGKRLLIVESPTKMKTLSKFLGKGYAVMATYGHIKDLPKSKLGVEIEKGFEPQFQVIKGKSKVVEEIKRAILNADKVYIGSDPDREGEAIAFHVAEEIDGKTPIERVLFHEITKNGVKEAINAPVLLNEWKYNAQKARRVLDRLVGYQISPILWEKLSYGLSAGRVQSVALRFVCDREEEIEGFVKEEYWVIEGEFRLPSGDSFKATLEKRGGEKIRITSEEEAKRIKAEIEATEPYVMAIDEKERAIRPQPAFITSRLQQEASRRFKFSPKKTMLLAQRLYEGVEIGETGQTGLITYMRTDSVRVSKEAVTEARGYIEEVYGAPYLPKQPNIFKNKRSAQDAHEAIRPVAVSLTPEKVRPFLDKDLFSLYELIWKRFVASQMSMERLKTKVAEIACGEYTFVARGSRVIFDGFARVYEEQEEGEKEAIDGLPEIKKGEPLKIKEMTMNQRFTSPPPRYTEASLIKVLEQKGIGRPSTYATIVGTIQDRKYVKRENGKLIPTPLGITVNKVLKEFFPLVVDPKFTAVMEDGLDLIEEGKGDWVGSLEKFYHTFHKAILTAKERMKSLKKEETITDIVCDRCGERMILRWGKNGEYLVCSNRPQCKNKKNVTVDADGGLHVTEEEVKGRCPQCGGDLIEKRGRFGRFLACKNYPECKYTEPFSLGFACPVEGCSGRLIERVSKTKRRFVSCSRYPECQFATNAEPVEGPCPSCSAPTLFHYKRKAVCLRKGCGWKSE